VNISWLKLQTLWNEGIKTQSTLTSLLLITSVVVLACVLIDYAVTIVQETVQNTDIQQLDRLKNLEGIISNQTGMLFNQTQPPIPNDALP
jgi:hypothetical protein